MSYSPLISICMITYNHKNYIAEAIQSIKDQTYTNWELIIVDNASTDDTTRIIEDIIVDDKRIVFLPQEQNLYVSHGANIAIEGAKGEYIAIFSGDDVFVPEKLERQLAYMQQKDLDLSFTWITAIDEYSKPSPTDVQKWFNKAECTNINEILQAYFSMHNVTCAPTALMKTALLQKTHLFDHRLLQTQDMELWIRLMKQTNKVEILHEKLTHYRVLKDGGNLSSNAIPIKRNRTSFEMIQLWKELFYIDNTILSKVFDIRVNNTNKYAIIYDYMQKNSIDVWQYAILTDIYTQLTEKCDTKTELFKLFFDKYGRFSIVSDDVLMQKEEAIAWQEEQLENNKKILSDKQEGISWLEEQLENHQKVLVDKEEGIAWLEGQVESYQKVLVDKEESIAWFEGKVKNYQKTLIEKEKMIGTYQKIMQEIDIKILQREEQLNVLQNELSRKTDHINMVDGFIYQKDMHIEGLEKELGFKKTFKRLIKFTIGRV